MKKHKKLIIIFLICIVLIAVIVAVLVIRNNKEASFENGKNMHQFAREDIEGDMMQDAENGRINKTNTEKSNTTLKTTTEVTSALTENVELHTTYYIEEVYVEENQFIASGENILKYTNGTYLVAPYNCYIIELNLPEIGGKALNSHYIKISSSNSLMVTMNVDETNIDDISIGLEATIEVISLGKTYTGNVTHIASTGNNGKFEIKIEFENDGNILIGMTSNVVITI